MRVGLVVPGDLETRSGGYLYDRTLIEHLRARGIGVDVVSLSRGESSAELADTHSRAVSRELRDLDVNVLLQDELCHPALAQVNRRLRREVDYEVLAIVHHLRFRDPLSPMEACRTRRLESRYLHTVDGFVATSESTRRDVDRLLDEEKPSVVTHPGGDRFDPLPTRDEIASRAREDRPLRVVFVGNVIPRKGLRELIDGLARLPTGSWSLDAIGDPTVDPDYVETVRARIDERDVGDAVSLHGACPDDELRGLLASGDVLAVPSTHEGFGIVYLEGMGFGLPALATTAGGAAEVVDDGETGFLVPPGDVEAIAEALSPLCDDRELLARLGLAARARFEAHPTWAETCETVHGFVRRFADAGSGTAEVTP